MVSNPIFIKLMQTCIMSLMCFFIIPVKKEMQFRNVVQKQKKKKKKQNYCNKNQNSVWCICIQKYSFLIFIGHLSSLWCQAEAWCVLTKRYITVAQCYNIIVRMNTEEKKENNLSLCAALYILLGYVISGVFSLHSNRKPLL